MKVVKICIISVLCGIFTSCYDGEVNGREYYLKKTCINSHIEKGATLQPVGKLWVQMPYSKEVCDKYKTDTIWEEVKHELNKSE